MRLGTRLDPRAKERLRRVSSSGGNEFVSRLTEGPVRTESDRPKADAEPLVLDDLVGAAVLGGGVPTWGTFGPLIERGTYPRAGHRTVPEGGAQTRDMERNQDIR